jgi:hypothetical protein
MHNPVAPLLRLGCCPYEKKPFDDLADGAPLLGKDKHAGRRLAGVDTVSKVARHRVPVVRDQDSILPSCDFEERRVLCAPYTAPF